MGNEGGKGLDGLDGLPERAGRGLGFFQRRPWAPSPFLSRRRHGAKRQLSHWTRTSPTHSPSWKPLKGEAQGPPSRSEPLWGPREARKALKSRGLQPGCHEPLEAP